MEAKMSKKIMLIILFAALLMLPEGLTAQKKFSFFLNGGFVNKTRITNSGFEWVWGDDNLEIYEDCLIDPYSAVGPNFSPGGGFAFQFSNNLGFEVSASYIKQTVFIDSDYYLELSTDSDFAEFEKYWENDGKVEIIPISFNLVYKTQIGRGIFTSLRGGVTVFLTRVELYSNIGWADYLEDNQFYYPDYYDLEVDMIERDTLVGLNIGLDVEKRINRNFSLYVGFEYYYAPPRTYYWELFWEEGMEILGELENLILIQAPDIHADIPVTSDLRISFYRAFGGIKIYL
jgi:hypothetical protein